MSLSTPIQIPVPDSGLELATLAGGCFWCIEAALVEIRGILDVESGYAGSDYQPASYQAVCTGETNLAEVVHVLFDPELITYERILQIFFVLHDPTSLNRQGDDIGTQYRSAIYVHNAAQRQTAERMAAWVTETLEQAITTQIEDFIPAQYTRAEDEHQEYFARNPESSYCQMLIPNKLAKLRANFADWLK